MNAMNVRELVGVDELNGLTPISHAGLVGEILHREKNGAIICAFSAMTQPDVRKRGNPFALPLFKISRVNAILNYSYERAVNRQRVREEGDTAEHFESAGLPAWLEMLPLTDNPAGPRSRSIARHITKGTLYLWAKIERALDPPRYFDNNGQELTSQEVKPWLSASGGPDRQKLDNPVIHRGYGVDNVFTFSMGGVKYEVIE